METYTNRSIPLIIRRQNGQIINYGTRPIPLDIGEIVSINKAALDTFDEIIFGQVRIRQDDDNAFLVNLDLLERIKHTLEHENRLATMVHLPTSPIAGLAPLTITNRIVNLWEQQLRANPLTIPQKEKLEAIAELLLDEAQPDRINLLTPRRRANDTQISDELFIYQLPDLRTDETHQEYAQILEITAETYDIAESSLEAFIALMSQHPKTKRMDGLCQVARKGFIPLSIVTSNPTFVSAISQMTGDPQELIYEALTKLEELYSEHRKERLNEIIRKYDKYLSRIIEPKPKEQNTPSDKPVTAEIAKTHKVTNKPKEPAISDELIRESHKELTNLIHSSAALIYETSKFAELMTKVNPIFSSEQHSYLPKLPAEFLDPGIDGEPIVITIEPYDYWFNTTLIHQLNSDPLLHKRIDPFFNTVETKNEINLYSKRKQTIDTLCGYLNSRTVDVFTESLLTHLIAQDLLTSPVTQNTISAINTLKYVLQELDKTHLNSLQGIRQTSYFTSSYNKFDSSKYWKRIAVNPEILKKPSEPTAIMNPDKELVALASCAYHLPLQITQLFLQDKLAGLRWITDSEGLFEHRNEIVKIDPTGEILDDARSARVSYSTSGRSLNVRGSSLRFSQTDDPELAERFKPVSDRYQDLFKGASAEPIFDSVSLSADPNLIRGL